MKNMKRYIDAYALENRVEDFEKITGMKLDIVHDFVSSQPTADVRENIKSVWIERELQSLFGSKHTETRCGNCGYEVYKKTSFCPNCGADMREVNHG